MILDYILRAHLEPPAGEVEYDSSSDSTEGSRSEILSETTRFKMATEDFVRDMPNIESSDGITIMTGSFEGTDLFMKSTEHHLVTDALDASLRSVSKKFCKYIYPHLDRFSVERHGNSGLSNCLVELVTWWPTVVNDVMNMKLTQEERMLIGNESTIKGSLTTLLKLKGANLIRPILMLADTFKFKLSLSQLIQFLMAEDLAKEFTMRTSRIKFSYDIKSRHDGNFRRSESFRLFNVDEKESSFMSLASMIPN